MAESLTDWHCLILFYLWMWKCPRINEVGLLWASQTSQWERGNLTRLNESVLNTNASPLRKRLAGRLRPRACWFIISALRDERVIYSSPRCLSRLTRPRWTSPPLLMYETWNHICDRPGWRSRRGRVVKCKSGLRWTCGWAAVAASGRIWWRQRNPV